jgi:hypothetical protein
MAIDVELDIFSGRPNPKWTLSPAQEAEWLARSSSLPADSSQTGSEPPGLGYRGLVLHGPYDALSGYEQMAPAACAYPVRVYGETVSCADCRYRDPGRQLESWLLATAEESLDKNLLDIVRMDLRT